MQNLKPGGEMTCVPRGQAEEAATAGATQAPLLPTLLAKLSCACDKEQRSFLAVCSSEKGDS